MGICEEHPLELDGEEMRSLIERAMDRIVAHLDSLPEQPANGSHGGKELSRALVEPLPETGTPFDDLLDLLFERAIPCSFNTAGPGYLGYIPSGGIFHSAIADLISTSVNRYVGVWLAAPGLTQLEINVVRWLCEMVGYPRDAGGVLFSGGSLANLTALVTARRERLGEQFLDGTLYTSDQTHHSVLKAAVLAGFPARNVRAIPSDAAFRIRTDVLERRIADDLQEGLQPFLVVGNAGTTNTGAVDDLDALADVAASGGLWLHVDAAYGGFFALTERGRKAMHGMERADSMTLDPHKSLCLPYGTGSLLVREVAALKRTHSVHADYMPAMQEAELTDFCELSPELSREFRGLRAWLPIKMHGIGVFRRNLDEKLDLAHWATDQLKTIPDVEIVAEPQLSLVVFRLRPAGLDTPRLNRLNQDFLDRINRRQRVMMTATTLGGDFALRICVLSFRTHRVHMERALEDIRTAAAELTKREASTSVAATCRS